jgi:hypothetical protein
MEVSQDVMSCYFLDTTVRKDKNTAAWSNRGRFALKLVFLAAAVWVHRWALARFNADDRAGPGSTQWALSMACAAIFVGRICLQMFVFWDRVTSWTEVFAEAGVIIPGSLLSLGFARPHASPFTLWLSFLVFAAGTGLNVGTEVQRHLFKKSAANQGKLFVGGANGVVRHPNYAGEIISFVGYAGLSGVWWNQWIPLVMGVGMVRWSVPELQVRGGWVGGGGGERWLHVAGGTGACAAVCMSRLACCS